MCAGVWVLALCSQKYREFKVQEFHANLRTACDNAVESELCECICQQVPSCSAELSTVSAYYLLLMFSIVTYSSRC